MATVSGLPLILDDSPPASGASLRIGAVQSGRGVARVYAAVSWAHDYAQAVLARGPLEALEQPELADAPVGSLLLTDADADRGVVVAERVAGGWILRTDDWDHARRA